jgi:hypothetical protein
VHAAHPQKNGGFVRKPLLAATAAKPCFPYGSNVAAVLYSNLATYLACSSVPTAQHAVLNWALVRAVLNIRALY